MDIFDIFLNRPNNPEIYIKYLAPQMGAITFLKFKIYYKAVTIKHNDIGIKVEIQFNGINLTLTQTIIIF